MTIFLNGEPVEVTSDCLADILRELGYGESKVATAINESFVATSERSRHIVAAGDRLEVLTAMQGG